MTEKQKLLKQLEALTRQSQQIINLLMDAEGEAEEEKMKEKKLNHEEVVIRDFLYSLRYNSGTLGYQNTISAIKFKIHNKRIKIGDIYNIIAEENNSTYHAVERTIRHSKEKILEKPNEMVLDIFGKVLNQQGNVSNSKFITVAAENVEKML